MIIGMINRPRWQDRMGSRMIVRGSRRLVRAVLIPLLLAAACAQSPDAGEATAVTPPPPKEAKKVEEPAPQSPSQRDDVVDPAPVDRFCRARFPDHYAALAVEDDQRSLIVYRRPLAGFDAAVRQRFPQVVISFRDARYSERELAAAVQRILADIEYWRERGVEITEVGPAGDGNSVLVKARDPGPARRLLSQHYDVAITVQPGTDVILVPPYEGEPAQVLD